MQKTGPQDPTSGEHETRKPGDGYVQSFARGLDVLRSFGAATPSQTLSEAAERVGHSVEMFLRTYAKWIDGGQNALEMGRLEAALAPEAKPTQPGKLR